MTRASRNIAPSYFNQLGADLGAIFREKLGAIFRDHLELYFESFCNFLELQNTKYSSELYFDNYKELYFVSIWSYISREYFQNCESLVAVGNL